MCECTSLRVSVLATKRDGREHLGGKVLVIFFIFFVLSGLSSVWQLGGFTQETDIDFLLLWSIFITIILSNTLMLLLKGFTSSQSCFCLHSPFSQNFLGVQCFNALHQCWESGCLKERRRGGELWRWISDAWGGGERSLNRAVCTVMPCSCAEPRSLGELECELIGLTVCNQSWFIVH